MIKYDIKPNTKKTWYLQTLLTFGGNLNGLNAITLVSITASFSFRILGTWMIKISDVKQKLTVKS